MTTFEALQRRPHALPVETSDGYTPLRRLAFDWMRCMWVRPSDKMCRDAYYDWQERSVQHCIEYQRWYCMWVALLTYKKSQVRSGKPTTEIPDLKTLSPSQLEALVEAERDCVLQERAAWLSCDPNAGSQEVVTRFGEISRYIPEHQTVTVYLNTQTRIKVAAELTRQRIVLMAGEIGVLLGECLHWPLEIEIDGMQFTSEGGVFAVRRYGRQCIEVTVAEGVVRMRSLPNARLPACLSGIDRWLVAGSRLRCASQGIECIRLRREQAIMLLAWCTGKLTFIDTPLEEVVGQFNRYHNELLEVTDQSLAGVPITGNFPINNVQVLLDSLHKHFDIQARRVTRLSGAARFIRLSHATPAAAQ